MKTLFKFDSEWQAQIIVNRLVQEGIECKTVLGAREYSSIVTGIGSAPVEILVDESEFSRAQSILLNHFQRMKLQLVDESNEVLNSTATEVAGSAYTAERELRTSASHSKYYRRIIFLSLASMVLLPIVLNVVAALFLREVLNSRISKLKKVVVICIFLMSFLISLFEVWWITRGFA